LFTLFAAGYTSKNGVWLFFPAGIVAHNSRQYTTLTAALHCPLHAGIVVYNSWLKQVRLPPLKLWGSLLAMHAKPLRLFFLAGIVVYNSWLKRVRLRPMMLWGSLLAMHAKPLRQFFSCRHRGVQQLAEACAAAPHDAVGLFAGNAC
jgi:hypothetical protein